MFLVARERVVLLGPVDGDPGDVVLRLVQDVRVVTRHDRAPSGCRVDAAATLSRTWTGRKPCGSPGYLTALAPGAKLGRTHAEASRSREHRRGLSGAAGGARRRVSLRQRRDGLRAVDRSVREAGRPGPGRAAPADRSARGARRGDGPRLR